MTLPSGLKTSPTQFDEDGNVILPGTVDATVKNVRAPTQPHEAATKGYVDDAIGSAGSSDKIQDTAGTTRVETEEETGRVTTTADGHKVASVGKDGDWFETEVDPATGTHLRVDRSADPLGMGIPGHIVRLLSGEDTIGISAVLAIPDGSGGVSEVTVAGGASDGDFFEEEEEALLARYVVFFDSVAGTARFTGEAQARSGSTARVQTTARETESPRADLRTYDASTGVHSSISINEYGVQADSGNSSARIVRPGGAELPSGDQSLADWIERVESEATASLPQSWDPTWTGAVNVDGTPVTNEGSIKVEGDYVDLEVEVEFESLGSGQAVVTAPLPGGIDPPTKDRYGQGTAMYAGSNFLPVLCWLNTSGTLTVGLTAASAAVHTACVRLRYKAEPVQ